MSSKRALRHRSCEGKGKHASRGNALAAARLTPHHRGVIGAYKCAFCHFWHIGRKPGVANQLIHAGRE